MSEDIAISVQNVSKKYRLFSSPNERLKEALHPFRKQYHHEFWALEGVSFDVLKGETLGILGRNGSGKSTLLQAIAAVLHPTSGHIEVHGKVSAILELGAGFNPEFTGRENVILNGVIQGVSRDEMVKRIPQIEAFADIGEFFDQPVKTYSSGMFIRVAFAATIHANPDILIIDEALAVGDVGFQAKCFAKIREFQANGATVVFVSHDTYMMMRLCDKAVVLHRGKCIYSGDVGVALSHYDNLLQGEGAEVTQGDEEAKIAESVQNDEGGADCVRRFVESDMHDHRCHVRKSFNAQHVRLGDGRAIIIDYLLVSEGNVDPVRIKSNSSVDIYMKISFHSRVENPSFGMAVRTIDGTHVYGTSSKFKRIVHGAFEEGEIVVCKFSFHALLVSGKYLINLAIDDCISNGTMAVDVRRGMIMLEVVGPSDVTGLCDLSGGIEIM